MRLLTTLFFIGCLVNCKAQIQFQADTLAVRRTMLTITNSGNFIVYNDSGKFIANYKDSVWKITDTMGTINMLMKVINTRNQQSLIESREYEAAKQVLRYVNTSGFVYDKNKQNFNKAVYQYQKLLNKK